MDGVGDESADTAYERRAEELIVTPEQFHVLSQIASLNPHSPDRQDRECELLEEALGADTVNRLLTRPKPYVPLRLVVSPHRFSGEPL